MAEEILVFDTSPLTHFAAGGWLGALKAVVGQRRAVVPDLVVDELKRGAATRYEVRSVLEAQWIEHHEMSSQSELIEYARFEKLLVGGGRNQGEAAALALAASIGAAVVVDDAAGRKAGRDAGLNVVPTLRLLCEAVQSQLLTLELVEHLIDDLLATEYRLPLKSGEFRLWAANNGLLMAKSRENDAIDTRE